MQVIINLMSHIVAVIFRLDASLQLLNYNASTSAVQLLESPAPASVATQLSLAETEICERELHSDWGDVLQNAFLYLKHLGLLDKLKL